MFHCLMTIYDLVHSVIYLVWSRVRVTLDGVLDWRLDLLTTLTHDS
jgi:hypothetical protein